MLLVWRWAMVWSALCGCLLSPALYLEPHLAIVYFLRFEYVRTWAVCQGRWESRAAPPCPWWRLWEPLDNRPHIPVETGPIQMGQAFVCNKRGLGMCIWRQGHMLIPHIELPSVRMFRYQVRFLPGWHGMQFRQYGVWLRCQSRDTGLSVPVYGPRQTWHQIRQQWVRFEFFLHESIKLLDLREPTPFQHPFSFSADTEDRFPCISTAA